MCAWHIRCHYYRSHLVDCCRRCPYAGADCQCSSRRGLCWSIWMRHRESSLIFAEALPAYHLQSLRIYGNLVSYYPHFIGRSPIIPSAAATWSLGIAFRPCLDFCFDGMTQLCPQTYPSFLQWRRQDPQIAHSSYCSLPHRVYWVLKQARAQANDSNYRSVAAIEFFWISSYFSLTARRDRNEIVICQWCGALQPNWNQLHPRVPASA